MAVTKTDKDFWVHELKNEINALIEEYHDEIEECRSQAFEYGLKQNNALKEYEECLVLYEDLENVWAEYDKRRDKFKDMADKLQDKLNDLYYEGEVAPNYKRREKLRVAYNLPDDTHKYGDYDDGVFANSWKRNLAGIYLKSVMMSNNVTEPLRLEELKKKVERGIMLATTSTKLAEFLERFQLNNGIEL